MIDQIPIHIIPHHRGTTAPPLSRLFLSQNATSDTCIVKMQTIICGTDTMLQINKTHSAEKLGVAACFPCQTLLQGNLATLVVALFIQLHVINNPLMDI